MGGSYIRLIAAAKANFDGFDYIPFDSSTYIYTNGRGGILDLDYTDNFVNFDDSYYYEYDKRTNSYNNSFHYIQSFNLVNNIQNRTQQDWSFVNTQYQWHNKTNLEYVYGNDLTQLIETKIQLWTGLWWDMSNYQIDYDAKGDMVKIDYQTNVTYLTYDNNHNIIERREYSYTPAGWQFTDRFSFTYDPSDDITGYINQRFINGNWENIDKKEFVISGSVLTSIKSYSWTNSAWQPDHQNVYTYDASNNKLTEEFQSWDASTSSFLNNRKETWAYNQQNQPISYYSQTWNTVSQNWEAKKGDFYNHYYYEFYSPTSVPELPKASDLFAVFPVPANNAVNIQLKKSTAEKYDGYIYDIQGKVVKTFKLSDSKETVPVENLPSGNYMIGVLYGNKKIAQPLIVAH
jgi:hypothetical protein